MATGTTHGLNRPFTRDSSLALPANRDDEWHLLKKTAEELALVHEGPVSEHGFPGLQKKLRFFVHFDTCKSGWAGRFHHGPISILRKINMRSQPASITMATRFTCLFVFALCAAISGSCEEPMNATVCQLKNDPPAYNHKLVEISGFVSHAFEDFTVFDPTCRSWPPVWLEYGGTSKSGTMYCCGETRDRHRLKELVVEDIPIPLLKNEQFEQFDKAIQPPFRSGQYGAIVHATLVGRFFAGKQLQYFKGNPWGGYGHMGCCTLLAIQEIKSADTENRSGLDYGAAAEQPNIEKVGCGYSDLLPIEPTGALQWQQEADSGKRDWAFYDPQRVASDTLTTLTKIDSASLTNMRLTHETQGRKVYEWKAAGKRETYMVVVSRPYWLSFHSHDPKRVAWTAIAAYESSCRGKNSVTRLK